jgi:hypothetical protein
MVPGVPPSKAWLVGARAGFGVDQSDPKVARIVEILGEKEVGEITIEEHKEFLLLNDELIIDYEAVHGKRIHPGGELVQGYKKLTREELVAAIDRLFEAHAKRK